MTKQIFEHTRKQEALQSHDLLNSLDCDLDAFEVLSAQKTQISVFIQAVYGDTAYIVELSREQASTVYTECGSLLYKQSESESDSFYTQLINFCALQYAKHKAILTA